MKKHDLRGFLVGILTMTLIFGLTSPAGAALTAKTIEILTGVEIYVDGVKMEPTDVNGNPVDTFVYNGTTYVPLRAVSQSLQKSVSWDGENQRVYIGEQPGEKQYLLKVCPPYQSVGFIFPETITMAGQKYTNCMHPTSYSGNDVYFNLNGAYQTLSFDIGHIDGESMMHSSVINIYLDGELAFSADLNSEMMPKHYDVPLNGALQMMIKVPSGNGAQGCYGLGNIEIY